MKKRIIIALALSLFLTMNHDTFAVEYSQQDVQRYSAYYSNGMEYLKNQQYSSAISEFKKVLRFSPYDETTQSALSGAYLARAQYYRETTKELKKALNDYKSALFYAKYWKSNGQISSTLASLASTAQKETDSIEKRLNVAQNSASRLQNAKNMKKVTGIEKELKKIEKNSKIELSDKQKEAVKLINENNVVIITGGPGTGKTTIIKTIIDIYEGKGKKVVLAAPTRKGCKKNDRNN